MLVLNGFNYFSGCARGKESSSAGDLRDSGLIPELERSLGGRHDNPLQCSCLESPKDRGAWRATVMGLQGVGHNCSDLVQHHSSMMLNQCDFPPSGSIWQCLETFLVVIVAEVEAKDTTKHSIMHRTLCPQQGIIWSKMLEVSTLKNPDVT